MTRPSHDDAASPSALGAQREPRRAHLLYRILIVLAGAAAGFLYQHFVGCRTGTCAITSSPYISTLYGAGMGLVASWSLRPS